MDGVAQDIQTAARQIWNEVKEWGGEVIKWWNTEFRCLLCKGILTILEATIKIVYVAFMVTSGAGAVVAATEYGLRAALGRVVRNMLSSAGVTTFCSSISWLPKLAQSVAKALNWAEKPTEECFENLCGELIQGDLIQQFLAGKPLFTIMVGFAVGELKAVGAPSNTPPLRAFPRVPLPGHTPAAAARTPIGWQAEPRAPLPVCDIPATAANGDWVQPDPMKPEEKTCASTTLECIKMLASTSYKHTVDKSHWLQATRTLRKRKFKICLRSWTRIATAL